RTPGLPFDSLSGAKRGRAKPYWPRERNPALVLTTDNEKLTTEGGQLKLSALSPPTSHQCNPAPPCTGAPDPCRARCGHGRGNRRNPGGCLCPHSSSGSEGHAAEPPSHPCCRGSA